jgi:hypothetical protein
MGRRRSRRQGSELIQTFARSDLLARARGRSQRPPRHCFRGGESNAGRISLKQELKSHNKMSKRAENVWPN